MARVCAALGRAKIKGFVLGQDKGLPKCLRLTYQYSLLQQQSLQRRPRLSVTTTPTRGQISRRAQRLLRRKSEALVRHSTAPAVARGIAADEIQASRRPTRRGEVAVVVGRLFLAEQPGRRASQCLVWRLPTHNLEGG